MKQPMTAMVAVGGKLRTVEKSNRLASGYWKMPGNDAYTHATRAVRKYKINVFD